MGRHTRGVRGILLKEGDFVINMDSDYGHSMIILFFNGVDEEDINSMIYAIDDYIYYGGHLPNSLYNFGVTSGLMGLSYKASSDVSINIALFTQALYSEARIEFTFYTNIDHSGSINSSAAARADWNFGGTLLSMVILATIPIIKSKNKKRT